MITRDRIEAILKEAGVLLEGHFLLTSGRHSNQYMQCAKIFRNPKYSEELCAALAEQYKDEGIDVVIVDEVSKSNFLDLLTPILLGKTVILVIIK